MSDLGPMRTIPFNEDKARDLACQGVWTVTRIGETVDLLRAAAEERLKADHPHAAEFLGRWGYPPARPARCQYGEGPGLADGCASVCIACAIGGVAFAVTHPRTPAKRPDQTIGESWMVVADIVNYWPDHPAAVHMRRLADELALRYGP